MNSRNSAERQAASGVPVEFDDLLSAEQHAAFVAVLDDEDLLTT